MRKDPAEELSNFNLSVAITDAFMEAVREGGDLTLRDPLTDQGGPGSMPRACSPRSAPPPGPMATLE